MVKYNLSFKDVAVEDVEAAVEWYEKEAFGLGKRFENELEKVLKKILIYPESYPFHKLFQPIRKVRLSKFPYHIFYVLNDLDVIVLGVIHTSRSNRFVKSRFK